MPQVYIYQVSIIYPDIGDDGSLIWIPICLGCGASSGAVGVREEIVIRKLAPVRHQEHANQRNAQPKPAHSLTRFDIVVESVLARRVVYQKGNSDIFHGHYRCGVLFHFVDRDRLVDSI